MVRRLFKTDHFFFYQLIIDTRAPSGKSDFPFRNDPPANALILAVSAKSEDWTMTLETGIRTQIAVLIYSMTNSVMFGAGLIVVLMVPALNADAGFWISAVVVASLILAAPFAWLVAPRLRARYWRQKLLAMPSRLASVPTRDH